VATMSALVARVRREIGDPLEPFEHQIISDGVTVLHDLPVNLISTDGLVVKSLTPPATLATLTLDTDFTLDAENGWLTVDPALTEDVVILMTGYAASLFSDAELADYVNDALLQHTSGRTVATRYRDTRGFIRFDEQPISVNSLPEIEEFLVALLATIEVLWALSTDASTDVDVQTAEGTFVARSQRYRQILQQIDLLTEKYRTLCEQLNVGLFRLEVSTLRRISRTNNRLVPVFKPREYDENGYPERLLPPIDHRHDDESGIPSQAIGGWW
jgi:hypothetical protein